MSPPRAGLLWLFISGVTIEIAVYLLSRELEVDLSRSNVDDRVGGVEEWSSKDDRYVFFFFSHVKNHEVGRDICRCLMTGNSSWGYPGRCSKGFGVRRT